MTESAIRTVVEDKELGRRRILEGDPQTVSRQEAELRDEWAKEKLKLMGPPYDSPRPAHAAWRMPHEGNYSWRNFKSNRIEACAAESRNSMTERGILELLKVGTDWISNPIWKAESDVAKQTFAPPPQPSDHPPLPEPPYFSIPTTIPPDPGPEPKLEDYKREINWLDRITLWFIAKDYLCKRHFKNAHADWQNKVINRKKAINKQQLNQDDDRRKAERHADKLAFWEARKAEYDELFNDVMIKWEQANKAFQAAQNAELEWIRDLHERYDRKEPEAIAEHARFVLTRSPYPEAFPRDVDAVYDVEQGILVAEVLLPNLAEASTGKSSDRNPTRKPDPEQKALFAMGIYSVMVRSLYELAVADEIGAFSQIVVNGRIKYIDRTTGRTETMFVASVQADRAKAAALNLPEVDPKECLKAFRANMAPELDAGIPTAISPSLRLDRDSRRIVQG